VSGPTILLFSVGANAAAPAERAVSLIQSPLGEYQYSEINFILAPRGDDSHEHAQAQRMAEHVRGDER
jgi:hypothetical protein